MKVLILTASNPYKTAGVVALNLNKALTNKKKHEVKILTWRYENYRDESILCMNSRWQEYLYWFLNLPHRIFKKFMRILRGYVPSPKTDSKYEVQGFDITKEYYSTNSFLKKIGDFKPNFIIVLFMQHFITYKNLYELSIISRTPILLYFMDMAPMTGGCHYAWDCKGFKKKCGKCPAFFSTIEYDQSRINWEYKNKYLNQTEIIAISASEWQYQQLQISSLFDNKPKHKILLGIDGEIFKPGNKSFSREFFKLPIDKKIIFFGAAYFDRNINKGFKELLEALSALKKNCNDSSIFHLAIAGNKREPLDDVLPFDYTYLGFLNHEELAMAFQAVDVFVSPSIEDSGPMMVNQSIMCGTPVVSFDIGVALDLVISGETGYRAKLKDTDDMANGILQILQLSEKESLIVKEKCRNLGLLMCSLEPQANKLLDLLLK